MLTSLRNVKRHTENGVTLTFPFDFKLDAASHLVVESVDLNGAITTLSYPADYSVTGLRDNDGGSITKTAAAPDGYGLVLRREVPLDQLTKLRGQTALDPVVIEDALDKLTEIAQQHDEELSRTLKTSVEGIDTELPTPEAGYALGWNTTGTGLVNVPTTGADQAADLASTTDAAKGAGRIGFSSLLSYAVGTVGAYLVSLAGASGAAQLGFTQSGIGATLRSIESVLRDRICVFDFMTPEEIADVKAKTYTLDVSAAFQAAITAANGREILCPAGGYKIATKLTYYNTTGVAQPKGLKILGEGEGNTIFKNEVANNPLFDINTGVGATAGSYFFSYGGYISGVTILGRSSFANSDGIRLRSCWDYRIDCVTFDNCSRYQIHIDNDMTINPDYTATANLNIRNTRLTGGKKGLYAPYSNGCPYLRMVQCYVTDSDEIGVHINSSHFQFIHGAVSYCGTLGTGDPSQSYGGFVIGEIGNDYPPKGVVIDGVELDQNCPQHIWIYGGKCPIIRNCSIVSRIVGGVINKYSIVLGLDSGSSLLENFQIFANNFQLPNTLASTGLTHTFVLTKAAQVKGGLYGENAYSIAGGTYGTEIFFIEEIARSGSLALAENRTRVKSQSGTRTRAAYKIQFTGEIPISKLSMPDDTAINLKPLSSEGVILVSLNGAAAYTAIIGFTVSGGKTYILTSGSTGIDISAVSKVLAGVDGTDGKITVSVDATTGKIYIENRQGGTLNLTAQIMEGFGSWL